MKVFISWSGLKSKAVAGALYDWIPYILSNVKPWLSDIDIQAGARWESELTSQVAEAECGILCLTAENQSSPWLLFEAGALSRVTKTIKIIPYRIDLSINEVAEPLLHFQGVDADEAGTRKLIESLNQILPDPLPKSRLETLLDVFWGRLSETLLSARNAGVHANYTARSTHDYLDEILNILRSQFTEYPEKTKSSSSLNSTMESLQALVCSLDSKITSMEKYEEQGGGAAGERWWDSYMERHRTHLKLLEGALESLAKARAISID